VPEDVHLNGRFAVIPSCRGEIYPGLSIYNLAGVVGFYYNQSEGPDFNDVSGAYLGVPETHSIHTDSTGTTKVAHQDHSIGTLNHLGVLTRH
jgi:hypothetical protein